MAQLWPLLFSRYGLEINFAHRTFAWGSDARGKAHVHVVILGLSKRQYEWAEKRLFSYDDINGAPTESRHKALSPYLFDAAGLASRHSVIRELRLPISDVPRMRMGSKLVDNGLYTFDDTERQKFLLEEPAAEPLFVPLVGSDEFINGISRWILKLKGVSPSLLRTMPHVVERIAAVKAYRQASRKEKTRELAQAPTEFEVTTIPTSPFLAVPKVSSERRDYVPIGWLSPPTLPSQLVQIIVGATEYEFGIVTSRMHMAWLRYIGGRLESRYQYSIGLVYNAFVWPEASEAQRTNIRDLAQAVLDARAKHPGATLADLYDPDTMPADLRKAHHKLDAAVDALYRRGGFASDRERVEHLFMLYEKLVAPLTASARKKTRAKRAASKS